MHAHRFGQYEFGKPPFVVGSEVRVLALRVHASHFFAVQIFALDVFKSKDHEAIRAGTHENAAKLEEYRCCWRKATLVEIDSANDRVKVNFNGSHKRTLSVAILTSASARVEKPLG